jgi:hypothetical protein
MHVQIDQKLAEEVLHAELENLAATVAQHKELLEEKLVEEVGGRKKANDHCVLCSVLE